VTLTPAGLAGAAEDDPLGPEPANLTGALIGYARVSTSGQAELAGAASGDGRGHPVQAALHLFL
jgi:hypothetical protein